MLSLSLRRTTALGAFHLRSATGSVARTFVKRQRKSSKVFREFSILGARQSTNSKETHELVKDRFGPGAKPGTIPTGLEQATGPERAELLAALEGRELWDLSPLKVDHLGTKADPIIVRSSESFRLFGCTGFPADSHDILWLRLERSHEFDRCPECGSVYKLNYDGPEDGDAGHHH
ncbi:hypothetical protein G9A89_019217 [Geosiphon pyriformis]|nr:hypothetical protein G9A89_019217 [Geosiphon pyriformis]